jgi:single-strand DNA-binding protein
MDNTVTLVGNMTRAPELRYTAGGRGVASFGLAVNRRWMQNNEWKEEVSFFNVTAWAELGENCAASLEKGNRVIVSGRLQQRTYDDREGNKRDVTEVIADSIGADLKWATCEVTRTERTPADPGRSSRQAPASNDPMGDEEPF